VSDEDRDAGGDVTWRPGNGGREERDDEERERDETRRLRLGVALGATLFLAASLVLRWVADETGSPVVAELRDAAGDLVNALTALVTGLTLVEEWRRWSAARRAMRRDEL